MFHPFHPGTLTTPPFLKKGRPRPIERHLIKYLEVLLEVLEAVLKVLEVVLEVAGPKTF